MLRHFGLAGLLGLATTGSVGAWEDWTEFRGPSQNGVLPSTQLPTKWDEKTNVVWFTSTPGLGWSSPVISGRRIYVTTAIQDSDGKSPDPLAGSQRLALLCLDADSGKLLFEKTIFEQPANAPSIHKKNSHASPTPILDQGKLYLHFGHQGTACTDLDGKILWSNQDHVYPPTHGNGGSPILVRDKLIFTCDGGDNSYTVALDTKTGKEVWKTPRGIQCDKPFSFCTPQLIQVNGSEQVVSPGSNIVQSLNPETGEVIWSLEYDGFSVIPRPIYHGGLVMLSTGYMSPKILAIDPTGKGDVTKTHLRWTYKGGAPNTPSCIPYRDELIMVSDSGIAASVDIRSGKEKWRKRIGGNYSASPTLLGNLLFLQSETGEAIVFEVGDSLQEVSRNPLPGRIFASYAVKDNDWIIRAESGIYRIGNR